MRVLMLATALVVASMPHLFAGDGKVVTVRELNEGPSKFEGKTLSLQAEVSGTLFEGPVQFRLTVKAGGVRVGAGKMHRNGINFVVAKAQKDKIVPRSWKEGQFYLAKLTLRVKREPKGTWLATVTEIEEVDDPIIKGVPPATPTDPKDMNLKQLLTSYDSDDADNGVGQRLTRITKGKRCLVFKPDLTVDIPASEAAIKEVKAGLPDRAFVTLKGMPFKTYRVGETPAKLLDQNPLYPKEALRSDGTCDHMQRSWGEVPLVVRQVIYLAATKSGEIKVEKADDAHAILDKLAGLQAAKAEKWVKTRYPKAFLLHQDLKERGELPSMKLSPVQRSEIADQPKPPEAPTPPKIPAPSPKPPVAAPAPKPPE